MPDNKVLTDSEIDELFPEGTHTIEEIKNAPHFLSLANTYSNIITQYNYLLNEFIIEYGGGFDKFNIKLNKLLADISILSLDNINEFITEYGNGSDEFTVKLNILFDNLRALAKCERDIEEIGYNLIDVCKAQNAQLIENIITS